MTFPAGVDDFLDFMPETVTIYPFTSVSVSGSPTYSSTGTPYPARIEMKNRVIVVRGREVNSIGRVFMGTTTAPDIKDKIVLPSKYSPVSPPIIDVNPTNDEFGTHHVTLWLGKIEG